MSCIWHLSLLDNKKMTFYSHFFTDYRWIRNEQEIIVYVKKLSTFPTDVIEAARIDGGKNLRSSLES